MVLLSAPGQSLGSASGYLTCSHSCWSRPKSCLALIRPYRSDLNLILLARQRRSYDKSTPASGTDGDSEMIRHVGFGLDEALEFRGLAQPQKGTGHLNAFETSKARYSSRLESLSRPQAVNHDSRDGILCRPSGLPTAGIDSGGLLLHRAGRRYPR